jgi:hypothetical protein
VRNIAVPSPVLPATPTAAPCLMSLQRPPWKPLVISATARPCCDPETVFHRQR